MHTQQNKAPTPIDHKAAAKKLEEIIRLTSNRSEHIDLIKSLPSFKDTKKESFVKQMEKQRNLQSQQNSNNVSVTEYTSVPK